MTTKITMDAIVNLAKNRGFVYAGSEIYGGLANSWDYGPYGSIMKENIKFLWQKQFVQKREDMMMLDSAILMNPQVWVASGHVGGFSDPLIDDRKTKERFRADKLLEGLISDHIDEIKIEVKAEFINYESLLKAIKLPSIKDTLFHKKFFNPIFALLKEDSIAYINKNFKLLRFIDKDTLHINDKDLPLSNEKIVEEIVLLFFFLKYGVTNIIPESWPVEKQAEVMRGEKIKNPRTGEEGDWTDVKKFNLMFKTFQGVTEDSTAEIYLRPETAQGIFINFGNIARTSRKKVPFGVAQVGKAFRNEITPGNFIFRTREFEQMEIEYFCEPEQIAPGKHLEVHSEWKNACYDFLTKVIAIKSESLRMRDHETDELSHYSAATTDIEYMFPFGWGELWGIADRTDFDLKAHMSVSKQDLSYFDAMNNRKYIPYVIEPSVGLTRLFLATLIDAYTEEDIQGDEGATKRIYLKLDPKVAPIKVGVLPVVKKIGDDAKKVFAQLTEDFICEYDEAGSVGKRYARFDEIGTPFCVTIDSENYANGKVTVRYRDSMEQELVDISQLNHFIHTKLK